VQCNIHGGAAQVASDTEAEPINPIGAMTMYVTPEQVTANSKASVEAMLALANSNFAVVEKLAALNFNATKSAFEDSMSHAKALLNAKDVQEFVNLNVAAAQPSLEKLIAYSRSVYELSTQQQAEITRLFESQAGEFNRSFVGMLDKYAKNAPAGSDVAIAAVKSALAAANSAYDSFAKVTKQASEIAEANMAAATAAVTKDGKKKAA
jgi:phasin family protein